MIWLAILITVVSSTSCSVGKALQKEAVSAGRDAGPLHAHLATGHPPTHINRLAALAPTSILCLPADPPPAPLLGLRHQDPQTVPALPPLADRPGCRPGRRGAADCRLCHGAGELLFDDGQLCTPQRAAHRSCQAGWSLVWFAGSFSDPPTGCTPCPSPHGEPQRLLCMLNVSTRACLPAAGVHRAAHQRRGPGGAGSVQPPVPQGEAAIAGVGRCAASLPGHARPGSHQLRWRQRQRCSGSSSRRGRGCSGPGRRSSNGDSRAGGRRRRKR